MITLYHCMSARSFRPLWTLEELGLPYELKMLPFPPRALANHYLDLNPLGTVPLLLDGETRMTESAAICQYLVALSAPSSLNVEPGESDFGTYLNYLHFGEATLTFPQMLALRYSRLEPEERRQPQVAEDCTESFLERLGTLEPLLSRQNFLCAGRFTTADISVGYALLLAEHLGLAPRVSPAVLAYWDRLKSRAGFTCAVGAQERAAIAQGVPCTSALEMEHTACPE